MSFTFGLLVEVRGLPHEHNVLACELDSRRARDDGDSVDIPDLVVLGVLVQLDLSNDAPVGTEFVGEHQVDVVGLQALGAQAPGLERLAEDLGATETQEVSLVMSRAAAAVVR